jgi:hypothetical protein
VPQNGGGRAGLDVMEGDDGRGGTGAMSPGGT